MGILKDAAANTSPESKRFVQKNLDITSTVIEVLKQKGWSQKDLAKALNKSPSEISKWLSGLHNLTLRSIIALECALEQDLIYTAKIQSNHE